MRILYVVNTYADPSNPAAEPFVKAQIDSVRTAGVDVNVFNVNGPASWTNYAKALPRVRRLVKREAFDLVHGHYVYSGWIAALQDRSPSVVSFMGGDLIGVRHADGRKRLRGRLDALLSQTLRYRADGIIVKSDEMARLLPGAKHLMVLPNGVDFDVFRPLDRGHCLSQLGLDPAVRHILHVGNPHNHRKGFEIARAALNLLPQRLNCSLLSVNGVPHETMAMYMNAASILVLPSQWEGSPNVIKEAMACNLPIVATDVGDVGEIIAGTQGCTLAHRTPEAFAQGIEQVLEVNRTTGRDAIAHLRSERIAARLLAFYETTIARCAS